MSTETSPPEPGVGAALKHGWSTMTSHFWVLLGIALIYVVAGAISNSLTMTLGPDDPFAIVENLMFAAFNGLWTLLVIGPLAVGIAYAYLKAARGTHPSVSDSFEGFRSYLNAVAGMFLMQLAIGIGFVLLIIPGIIALVRLSFVPFLLGDRKMGPVEALKESWRLTSGHGWSLFGLFLVAIPILFVGALLLIVGLIPATMLVWAAIASYYYGVTGPVTPAGERPVPGEPTPGTEPEPA